MKGFRPQTAGGEAREKGGGEGATQPVSVEAFNGRVHVRGRSAGSDAEGNATSASVMTLPLEFRLSRSLERLKERKHLRREKANPAHTSLLANHLYTKMAVYTEETAPVIDPAACTC